MQLSPDTVPGIDAFGGGYSHADERIAGFSLRHLSGPGCAAYQDVPITPTLAPVRRSPVRPGRVDVGPEHQGRFRHAEERARPGDYRVRLHGARGTVDAALTATTRVAVARLRFSRPGAVLLNAGGSIGGADLSAVRVDPARREVSGTVASGRFCYAANRYRLHFVARFSRRFAASGTWREQRLHPGARRAVDTETGVLIKQPLPGTSDAGNRAGRTAQAGAYVRFADRDVEVRIGVSHVDLAGARRNLEAEAAGRSVEAVRARARGAWRRALGAARVRGGARRDRRRFATALYHALLHPSTVSDADGRYAGMDGRVHRARGFRKLSDVSGWDTYRTQVPLLAMLAPARARDLVRSLLADARESGYLGKWTVADGHTNVMVGDPALPMIASVHALGVRGFDEREALRAMLRNATVPGRSANAGYVPRAGLAEYLRLGYVPYELSTSAVGQAADPARAWGSTATTLEYAIADFALARFAARTGRADVCRGVAPRGASWRRVLDPATRRSAPRSASGAFVTGGGPQDGFAEGSASQYTWLVPHDPAGLARALGGRRATVERLDEFFAQLNAGPDAETAFLGNEVGLGTPWLYTWLGRPDRTQAVVRRALLELYDTGPGGFPGNDVLGALSAWWVLGALGLHPAVPGTDVVVLGSPLFPRATLRLPGGRLTIRAPRAGRGRPHVTRAALGGAPVRAPWLRFGRLARGGRLDVALARRPARWGRTAPPPSFGPARTCAP